MEAYRIERFGSVDGIVLRSSQDPRPGLTACRESGVGCRLVPFHTRK